MKGFFGGSGVDLRLVATPHPFIDVVMNYIAVGSFEQLGNDAKSVEESPLRT